MPKRRTPLYGNVVSGGASFQEWGDWELPRSYSDVLSEYVAGTEAAAVHDSSYLGRLKATGQDVLDLLHRLSTNDLLSLKPGQGAPTVLTTDRGRILDLITLLNLGDYILILSSPGAADRVVQWIEKYTIVDDVTLEDVTDATAMLSIIGPDAHTCLSRVVSQDVGALAPYHSFQATVGSTGCHVIRRDTIGLPSYDVVIAAEEGERVWREMGAAGAVPIGMEAYEAIRVGLGAPSYDRELSDAYNPLETGLWGSISFTKGCYIGQEVIARLDTYQKVQKHLVSLSFSANAVVEEGSALHTDGKEVGHVTSVATVPGTGELIGLGYVRKEAAGAGTRLRVADGEGSWVKVGPLVLPFGPGDSV